MDVFAAGGSTPHDAPESGDSMPKLRDLKIRTKVAAAFGLVLVVTLALGLFAAQRLGIVYKHAADVRDTWLPGTRALGDYAFQTMRVRQMEAAAIFAPTPESAAEEEKILARVAASAQKAWALYEATDMPDEERHLADRIKAGWENYLALDEQLRQMLMSADKKDAAYPFYVGRMRSAYRDWRDTLVTGIDFQMRQGDRAFKNGERAYISARSWIFVALALAVMLACVAGFFIVASVSRPILGMTQLMGRLAKHDLSVKIDGIDRKDEMGKMARAVEVFKESMIEGDRLSAELQRQARIDPLTGALNRRAFRELIGRDIGRARRHSRPLSIAMIDVDHFKRFNDTQGHAVGDKVLVVLARTIVSELRTEDFLCRYGGEEFIVALSETHKAGSVRAAERLRAAIADIRLEHGGDVLSITASLGVATFGQDGDTIDDLVNAADLALYCAKADGRNRVVSYKPEMGKPAASASVTPASSKHASI
jgi:diguanylate cyclase (GGDEF)-like protein